jgi:endo-1,4-beta-xylanase
VNAEAINVLKFSSPTSPPPNLCTNVRLRRPSELGGSNASAFTWARAADPSAKLFISDSSVEAIGQPKADAFYALVQDLRARGAPIDGVGFHGHLRLDDMMAVGSAVWKPILAAGIQRFNDLGLEVQITELDVSIVLPASQAELQDQASVFRDVLDVCLAAQNNRCTAFNMWGFTDKYSWIPTFRPGEGAALIFDTLYNRKPAYYSLSTRLSQ